MRQGDVWSLAARGIIELVDQRLRPLARQYNLLGNESSKDCKSAWLELNALLSELSASHENLTEHTSKSLAADQLSGMMSDRLNSLINSLRPVFQEADESILVQYQEGLITASEALCGLVDRLSVGTVS